MTHIMPRFFYFLIIFVVFFNINYLGAQAIVTLNPAFPAGDDALTLTFYADQGNAGLANLPAGSVVYAHAGITVNDSPWQYVVGNWGTIDNRVAMTRIGNTNQYTLTMGPSIRSWYSANNNAGSPIGSSDIISQLCMVFRNADGSLEGKTSSNSDIFVDLATASFSASITSHPQSSLLLNSTQTINFTGQSSAAAALGFSLDGTVVSSASATTSLNYSLVSANISSGLHTLVFSANNGSGIINDTILITKHSSPNIAALPNGAEEGITYTGQSSVYLQLRAPYKDFIYVLGDFNEWAFLPEYKMNKTPDGQFFWIEINNLDPNREYRFQYSIDWEGLRVTDPYCEKVLDPWGDPWISPETYPNPTPYPTGLAEGIVGIIQISPPAYNWDASYTYNRPPKEDLVVYELLVRDFSEKRSFTDVIERLPYIDYLGVNAIQLMPVTEFDGNESWGYAPDFFMAVDKYYGTKNELKRLIDSCHSRGIAVISDVVFNHAFGQSPMLKMYFDPTAGEFGQPTAQSPWFNQIATHPYSVGFDFNHESGATKYFVKKVLKHWLQEYKLDGYRFDLSKGFTQNNTGSNINAWSNYDQSRIDIILDYTSSIRQTDANAYIILEHLGAFNEESVYANNGLMLWGKGTDYYNEATMGYLNGQNQNLYNTTPQYRGWGNYGLLSYMESHDEERLMYKNIAFGNSTATYNTREINTALKRMAAATAFFIPLPGPKMIWQFGELGYDVSITDCGDGTFSTDCRTSNKPVRWEYFQDSSRRELFDVYRKLIYLKKTQPQMRDLGLFMDLGQYEKVIRFTGNDFNCVIAGNFDVVGQEMNPGFPFGGKWYDYLSGDSLDLNNPGNAFSYAPGEFHVYLDRRIIPPANALPIDPVSINIVDEQAHISVFPNPFDESISIRINGEHKQTGEFILRDLTGRIAIQSNSIILDSKNQFQLNTSSLKAGIYFYSLVIDNKTTSGKIVKN